MGVPKRKPSTQPAAHAPRLQQRAETAATEHVPAMRRAVCAAPGLPGLRLLQGPPGVDRHGRRLIGRPVAEKFPRSFIYANSSGCHGRRPRVRGRHRRRQAGAGGQQENHRPLPGRRPGRDPRRPARTAAFATIACASSTPAKSWRWRTNRPARCAKKATVPSPAPPNWSAKARPTRWFRSATPAASSRRPRSRSAAFPAWIAAALPRSFRGRKMNLSCSTPARTSNASRCTWRNSP